MFNMGLPILESEGTAAGVETNDELEIDLDSGLIVNLTQGQTYQAEPIPEFMQELLKTGGLIPYIQQKMKQEA
jgi:3-isopropylmalate/(R)-2-methylmalate dehydratase small subunit